MGAALGQGIFCYVVSICSLLHVNCMVLNLYCISRMVCFDLKLLCAMPLRLVLYIYLYLAVTIDARLRARILYLGDAGSLCIILQLP